MSQTVDVASGIGRLYHLANLILKLPRSRVNAV